MVRCSFAAIRPCNEDETIISITDYMGGIPKKDEWEELKAKIDNYYACVSDKEIEETNYKKFYRPQITETKNYKITFETTYLNSISDKRELNSGFVYVVKANGKIGHKIGYTRQTLYKRFALLANKLKTDIHCTAAIPSKTPEVLENYLHSFFGDKRIKGEFFDLSEEDLMFLNNYKE